MGRPNTDLTEWLKKNEIKKLPMGGFEPKKFGFRDMNKQDGKRKKRVVNGSN